MAVKEAEQAGDVLFYSVTDDEMDADYHIAVGESAAKRKCVMRIFERDNIIMYIRLNLYLKQVCASLIASSDIFSPALCKSIRATA